MRNNALYIIVALILSACTDNRRAEQQWDETAQKLEQLDDSVNLRTSNVPALIEQGLASANDSIEWYLYYIRWAAYFSLTSTPDSSLFYTHKTIDFVERQRAQSNDFDSRRLNTLEGSAYELTASYFQHYRILSDSCISLHQKAYDLTSQGDMLTSLPKICGNMADAYALQNKLPNASSWYRRAIFLADSLHATSAVKSSLYMGLGRIYLNLSDFKNSKLYYDRAEESLDSVPPHMQLYFLNNYGNYYYYQKDYASALKLFQRMENLIHEINGEDSYEMFLCQLNMGDVYLNMGDTERAISCVNQAEPFFEKNRVKEAVYYCKIIRFGVAVSKGNLRQAEQLLPVVLNDVPIEDGIIDVRNRYVFDYYVKSGQIKRALEQKLQEEQREDSIDQEMLYMRVSEMMMRMGEDTLRLHHQLEMAQQRAYTQQAYLGIVILSFLLVLLLLAVYMWWTRQRKNQTKHEMDILRLRLLGVRQRISPHFVFNVLNHHIGHSTEVEEKELIKLVKLIRANLTLSDDTVIALSSELEFVNHYVELEQDLMDDLSYTVDIAPEVNPKECLIPSMFVQILVENAIKHGLKGLQGPKQLAISVTQTLDAYRVMVTDNGRGYDHSAVISSSTGNGLAIIQQTMEIFNTHNPLTKMDMTIRNLTNSGGRCQGCEACLIIPKIIKNIS